MAYFNKPEVKAGNFSTTISELGKTIETVNEQGETVTSLELVKKGDYGYSVTMKFGNEKFGSYVNFPFFKINTNPADYQNYLNLKAFKVSEIIQTTPENEAIAAKSYTDTYLTYMVDLLSVYFPKVEKMGSVELTDFITELKTKYDIDFVNRTTGKPKTTKMLVKDLGYKLMKDAKVVNSSFEVTPFYTYYGHYQTVEGTTTWEGENDEPKQSQGKNGINNYGKVNDRSVYLTKVTINEVDYLFSEVDRSTLFNLPHQEEVDAQLEWSSNAHTIWMGNFLESCLQYVIANNKGQKGYIYRTWQVDKKNNYYLKPMLSLKSLVVSRGITKVDNAWVEVTPETQHEYPDFKGYYYGAPVGLTSKEQSYKVGDEWISKLQFCFRAEPFNEFVEGNDTLVSRRTKYNPKFIMTKPEIEVPEEEEIANDVNDTNGEETDETLPF